MEVSPILCGNCGKRMAEYLLFDEVNDRVEPLCEACLDEYCHYFGELTLTYIPITDLEAIIREFNRILKYWSQRYKRLLDEYHKIKERCEGG